MASLPGLTCAAVLAGLLTLGSSAGAQDGTIHPLDAPPEPNAIPLGTGGVEGQTARESWFRQWGDPMARNVSTATLTPFLPEKGKANGAAVIVAPGGGFRWLSMGNEGWEVAQALNARGIAAFVLKYRLQPTPDSLDAFKASMERTFAAAAGTPASDGGAPRPTAPRWDLSNQLQDAEAAYALIVRRAAEWGVDTSRLGMIGFSAGAGLTMHGTLNSKTMKLAFIGPIYGGMGPVEVPRDAPPMFTAIATDDFLFRGQFGVVKSWFDAGRPVEFHLYQNGGHGFGLGNPNRTSNRWFDAFIHWLDVNGFLAPKASPSAVHQHHRPSLDERGAKAMGFDQQQTRHQFTLFADGGAIEVRVKEASDATNRDAIRSHLPHIATMFAAGRFDTPLAVHDSTQIPGTEVMSKRQALIRYQYVETPLGGRVDIVTRDAEALAAVHEFLRFQIADHATGDPATIRTR